VSWQAVQWALHRAPMLRTAAGKFDATARFVLTAVAEHADASSPPRAHPSLALLRYTTGLDMKTVQRALGRLAAGGLIESVGVRGDGVTEWALKTELVRPVSDREAIDAEVQDHRDRDRRRKKTSRASGALRPDTDSLSGTQSPDVRTQNPGHAPDSGAHRPDIQGVESGHAAVSGTLNPDSGALSPDVRDAEPARTDQGTTRNQPTRASASSDTLLPELTPPTTTPKSKPKKTPDPYPADFMALWEAAARRDGKHRGHKGQALKAWQKLMTAGVSNTALIAAARAYARDMAARPQFVKDLSGWLNGELYEPYLEQAHRHTAGEPTDAELDAVLGKALVTLPAPPDGIDYGTPAHQQWKAQFFRNHRAERVRQYLARTAYRTTRSSA